MKNIFTKEKVIKCIVIFFTILLPIYAAADIYRSELVNNSKQAGTNGYKLVRTKTWPSSGCLIDTGKQILYPGETTILKIKKSSECNESGVGYSMYKMDDTKNQHLLGYLSHRLGDGKFSIQISRFCNGDKCVFTDLNPEQDR